MKRSQLHVSTPWLETACAQQAGLHVHDPLACLLQALDGFDLPPATLADTGEMLSIPGSEVVSSQPASSYLPESVFGLDSAFNAPSQFDMPATRAATRGVQPALQVCCTSGQHFPCLRPQIVAACHGSWHAVRQCIFGGFCADAFAVTQNWEGMHLL